MIFTIFLLIIAVILVTFFAGKVSEIFIAKLRARYDRQTVNR